MTDNNQVVFRILLLLSLISLTACVNDKETHAPTLADIDTDQPRMQSTAKTTTALQKNQIDARKAYRRYIDTAGKKDSSRQTALTRLAQLELELSNAILKEENKPEIEQHALASLQRTITLLETSLRDYPQAQGNDKVLYQLAQAYDRSGRYQNSIDALNKLVSKYPSSRFYPEAQFRLAEAAFVRGDYITAEDAYTEVILTPGSEKFYEKSLFKRGWTRYKQQLYREAIDDYVNTLTRHGRANADSFGEAEKAQFDEYFRALGLAFTYLGGSDTMREYFSSRSDYPFIYETYATVGELYLAQERFSDAARIFKEYIDFKPDSSQAAMAEVAIIEAWRQGGFQNRTFTAIEAFYNRYRPESRYWNTVNDKSQYQAVLARLREYIVQISGYFHQRYNERGKNQDLTQAGIWYQRYLEHFGGQANQDNIYALYAELLLDSGRDKEALNYFRLAAYDGEIILDKASAYSSIVISGSLMDKSEAASDKQNWLNEHLDYARRYVSLYPADERSATIALSAAERAFRAQRYRMAIELANSVPDDAEDKLYYTITDLKAQSLLALNEFADAESAYRNLLDSQFSSRRATSKIRDGLALAIYRQGEQAVAANANDMALSHYTRIAKYAPTSGLAATGLFDAIALTMQSKQWRQAIGLIEEFKKRYPKHERINEVTKNLSVAYLNSGQQDKAAVEFERIAQIENNLDVKMAALWQAAELYEKKNRIDEAIRAYRDYAHTYKEPFEQNMEAMFKLVKLYEVKREPQKRYFWQSRIRRAEQNAPRKAKTERTIYIASTTTLDLAKQKLNEFQRYRLVEPIATNLKRKKAAMQESVKLFGQASSFGVPEITTEATGAIGDIYFEFSRALLDSERPKNLDSQELEQYEILLEDQAFPFEEKAIEFYEVNLARTQDDLFDAHIKHSFNQLLKLFPVRYEREGKIRVVDL